MSSKNIRLENLERDTKELRFKDGTVITLGSIHDKKDDDLKKRPLQELTGDQWAEIKGLKAIKGWLDTGAIRQL